MTGQLDIYFNNDLNHSCMENVLNEVKSDIDTKIYILQKEVLSLNEACIYLCISQSYMYKLTSTRKIPHYSPLGKLIYFKRAELDDWILSKKRCSLEEMKDTPEKCLKQRSFG